MEGYQKLRRDGRKMAVRNGVAVFIDGLQTAGSQKLRLTMKGFCKAKDTQTRGSSLRVLAVLCKRIKKTHQAGIVHILRYFGKQTLIKGLFKIYIKGKYCS